jgi:hypothetical protein
MPYEVPKSKAGLKANRFEFKIDGKVYSVPLLKNLPIDAAIKLGEGGLANLVAAFGEHEAVVRTLDEEQLDALTDAWAKASGITLGESSASETS